MESLQNDFFISPNLLFFVLLLVGGVVGYKKGLFQPLVVFFSSLNAFNKYKYGNLSKVRTARAKHKPVLNSPSEACLHSSQADVSVAQEKDALTIKKELLARFPVAAPALYTLLGDKHTLFSWWLVAGKERQDALCLAQSLCKEISSRKGWFQHIWQAGVVNMASTDFEVWKTWQPAMPTLLVFTLDDGQDTGENVDITQGAKILDSLISNLQYRAFTYPVRVLFVGKNQEELTALMDLPRAGQAELGHIPRQRFCHNAKVLSLDLQNM